MINTTYLTKSYFKICVRDWKHEDINIYSRWMLEVHKWQEFDGPYFKRDPEQIKTHITDISNNLKNNSFPELRKRMVIATKESDQLIGTVSYYWTSRESNWMSIGIGIYDESYWSQGIGKEALTLWIQYLFDNSDIVRLDLRTWSGNIGMIKLAEKLGFVEEARFRLARLVNHVAYDGLAFGILREEWKANFDALSGTTF